MKNKSKIFIILGIAVILITAGVLTFVFWPEENVKEIYTNAIKESLGLEKDKTSDFNPYDGKILDLTFEYNDISGEIAKNNKGEIIVDDRNEKPIGYILFDFFVEELEKNEQYEMFLENNRVYFKIKDVFDKYYYFDGDVEETNNESSSNFDSKVVLNAFEESFFDVIDGDNIIKDDREITINGKTYNSTKYSYTFTGTDLYTVLDNTFKKIKEKDVDLYENIDKNISLDSLEELKEVGNLFTYTFLIDNDEVISSSITINLEQKITLTQNKVDGYYRLYLSVDGLTYIDLAVKEENNKEASLVLSMLGQEMITGEFILEADNSISFTLKNTESFGTNVDIQGSVSADKNNGSFDISVKCEIGENVKNEIKINAKILDEMPKYDLSNSAPFVEITEEELEYINNRFGFITDLFNKDLPNQSQREI